ncbi:hypothetical protein GPECTOR_7g1192 [Gonium pectorale]|uniref:Uncharacterized protein n=1 Tax=Gonium pectorale TaxID=33097 RepID=A0A150GUD1_GONPE|nr:hypothetical protein GPECTOR_7g1192 [Gonium pectorale]|eukprot:KXZ53298.1 hypothetical protein GPECTOR_7g1192 [Gonium pectorale]
MDVDDERIAGAAETRAAAGQERFPGDPAAKAAPEASVVSGMGTTGSCGGSPAAPRRDNIGGGMDVTDIAQMGLDMTYCQAGTLIAV